MQRPKLSQASTCTLDTRAKVFAVASPINVFYDKLQQILPQVCICNRRTAFTAKKVSKWPTCCPLKPGFMRRLQVSKLRLERSPVLPCALHWWCQRTSSLQQGATGGAGDQEMRCHDQLPVQHFDSPVSSKSSIRRSTCRAKKFSKTRPKARQSRRVLATFQPAVPRLRFKCTNNQSFQQKAEVIKHLKLKPNWQAEDEPSAVWCTIEYLLTAEARAKADANYTLVFLLRPHLQGNLRSSKELVMWLAILGAMNSCFALVQALTVRPTGRPLHHSSNWPVTSPLVQLADDFATRPTGRPLRPSSNWPTTSPLVNEQTAIQLEILVIECLLCKIKFDYKEYFNSHFILKHITKIKL
ncbi:uncharacterized protein [Syngnathus scovelli]|uniref:uncharacterized protein isoform X3 n=1 Tax=Syngnathus scovelli TaxID=161590 RepID=UPI00211048F7|nr:uncharacterized protein LOC125987497 [Syngnathus scovelli]